VFFISAFVNKEPVFCAGGKICLQYLKGGSR